MIRAFSLTELSQSLGGTLHGDDARFWSVSTDSRKAQSGDLFVALRGERFDGHEFLDDVAGKGACGALVDQHVDSKLPQLQVADTELALGRLGALNRDQFKGPLLGITGSSGKTSVKNMLAAILSESAPTLATEGNLNNEIGVPLTLLRLSPEHRFAVIEMGAGKPGDIAYLAGLARPGISLLLNAMPAHLERMGSLQGIAETKGAILSGAQVAIYPADSKYTVFWRGLAKGARCLEFSFDNRATVHASELDIYESGSRFLLHVEGTVFPVELKLPGRHSIANAMAAGAAALAAGASEAQVQAGLAKVMPTGGRLLRRTGREGISVIDDSYNANPGSVKAAIDVLTTMAGRQVLALGTMAELGDAADELHAEIGRYARAAGIDALWGVGPHTAEAARAFGTGGEHFDTREALLIALPEIARAGDVVLVKGSRSAGMEQVVSALMPASARGEGT
ncbi:MAG: UDP-N-acetylmuramoyl-tripeptide--D-alanyl-D-alanine ligase [Halieaceae bacterium]|nr:UDP-N-acetylmuramoyl-tripeptide--D-alanyl-D-alanine ligase [Halieaceae bacterium]